jgi:hypothetical protein
MPLKDLVAKKSEIAESVIEAIVSKYVRYYTDTLEIGFTSDGAKLSSENKVLVHLVALLGWRYVTENPPVISTKPADLEVALGITGGTLRPLLKNLKDTHLISPSAEGYNIRESNLEAIAAVINGEKKPPRRNVPAARKVAKPKKDGVPTKHSIGNSISPKLDAWMKEGFFKTPRTLRTVYERLHEQGVIAQQTSVSGPLLKAVQQGRLTRRKISEDGKKVWAYCNAGG